MSSDSEKSDRESPLLARSLKRCNKQQMEKRRRGRINTSLDQLKSLVLQATHRDSAQYSKLEKADILEMTVKHLRSLQRQQLMTAAASDSSVALKYRIGFQECAGEVARYLGTIDGLGTEVRSRLLQHLSSCVSHLGSIEPHQQVPSATQMASLPGVYQHSYIPSSEGHFHQMAPQYSGSLQVIPGSNMAYLLQNPLSYPYAPSECHFPQDLSHGSRQRSDSICSTGSSSIEDHENVNYCYDNSRLQISKGHPKQVKLLFEERPEVSKQVIKTEPLNPIVEQKVAAPARGNIKQENMWRPW